MISGQFNLGSSTSSGSSLSVDNVTIQDLAGTISVKSKGISTDKIAADAITTSEIAADQDLSDKGFNADKVDGRDVDDTLATEENLWTASKSKKASIAYAIALG